MLLRSSEHKGTASLDWVLATASAALGEDAQGYRKEFLTLVEKTRPLVTPIAQIAR